MPSETDAEFIALQEALAGRYSLQRELGRGGMGIVYLAHEVALDRPVALKLLPPHLAAEPGLVERFMREARTAARLSQPNIVPIHRVDRVGRFVFFTMAYVEGESLGAVLRRRGALPAADAARILREVAWALAYAHAQGVVHRDVKPDNILLEEGTGRALVMDFGIAQVSATSGLAGRGEVLGTPEFMSPEQAGGSAVDARSDIYSLGVVGYLMLSGRLPFVGDSPATILAKHMTQPAPPVVGVAPDAPRHLAQAVDRCLAKNPAERFANGEDLAAALSRSLAVRRDIPLPLRVFIKQNREQLRGLPAWGVFTVYSAVADVYFALQPGGLPYALVMAGTTGLIAAAPAGMLVRMARQLLKSGYGYRDLLLALKDDLTARLEEMAFERHAERNWLDRLGSRLWYGGLAATFAGTGLAFVLDLNVTPIWAGLAALTFGGAVATMAALPIVVVRGARRPGLVGKEWSRFWGSRFGKWLFKLAGVGLKELPASTTAYRPTEIAIGLAAQRLFEQLPKETRGQLRDLPDVMQRLEGDAQAMRRRLDELSGLSADLEPGEVAGDATERLGFQREDVAGDLERARDAARARLQDAVAALEAIRLSLLRLHAGTGGVEGVTEDLSKASEIAADLELLVEGNEEVERALRAPRPSDAPSSHGASNRRGADPA